MERYVVAGLLVVFVVSVVSWLPLFYIRLGVIATQLAKIATELKIANNKK